MSNPSKSRLEIRKTRIFSEEFKRQKVEQIVAQTITVAEVSKLYSVSKMSVYRWLYQYSPHHQNGSRQVVQMNSEEHKTKQLLSQVADLERILGQKQLCIDYLEKLVEVSGQEFNVDLKKNFADKHLNGSASILTNTSGR